MACLDPKYSLRRRMQSKRCRVYSFGCVRAREVDPRAQRTLIDATINTLVCDQPQIYCFPLRANSGIEWLQCNFTSMTHFFIVVFTKTKILSCKASVIFGPKTICDKYSGKKKINHLSQCRLHRGQVLPAQLSFCPAGSDW